MSRKPLTIIPVPMDLAWRDPSENLRRMREQMVVLLGRYPHLKSEEAVFVFPELCLTGFVTEDPLTSALTRESEPVREVLALAKELGAGIVFGFPEKVERGGVPAVQNTIILADSRGSLLADYQKVHLFTKGKRPESDTYVAGSGPRTVEYRGWLLGFGICFDLRFPDLFIQTRRLGCDVLIIPTCWVGGATKSDQLQTLARATAVLTQCFVVAVNRMGEDPSFKYEGEALIYGPRAEVLLARQLAPEAISLDPAMLESARR